MELELGLKITKTKDDIDSISEFQLMKDVEPVFHSRENNTMFILTANLKGYKRNNIDIKISKDGSKISISGKKPIQEMVMMGWVMQRKVVDVKGFNKVFKIPHGVNLDKIKANYNEEEWMMSIVMPKLVKGICGLKIEEFKEQYFDKGKSNLEKSEIDHVSSSVGETSQKGSKDSEFQHREVSENIIEKMLDDDINKKFNKETIQREVGESKLRNEDGNGKIINGIDDVSKDLREKDIKEKELSNLRVEDSKVKDIGEKDRNETYEASKTLENMEKMLNETNKDVNEEPIEKEVGDSKLRIENGNGESAREKDDKEEYEVMKKSERDKGVGVFISRKFEDMSKDKEFEDQKMDSRGANKKHDDVSRDIIGGTLKEEEKEESIFRSEDGKVKDIGKGTSHNIVETSQRVFEDSMIQQSGESKQKESKEYFKESGKENSMEPFEAMKVLEVEQNVVGHIPSKIGCINQDEFEEYRIPQMETTTSTKMEMKGGEHEKFPFEANQDFQKEIIKPKMRIKDGDQECVLEKLDGKEGFDDGMVNINKEFPKHLPKSNSKEEGELNVEKMQETKNVKEEIVNKEVEYFVEKGEGERFERKHGEQKKENNTKETMREEIAENENVLKESGHEQFAGIEGSKGFNFENEEEQHKVSKEALDENETLMVEGDEHNERTKKIRHEMEDTVEYSIVKLKGNESIKMDVNELKESGHEKFTGTEGSKGFNFANEEEQTEVINDALVEDESLIMEGGEYKEKSKEMVQDEEVKNKHGIGKLKGEGSTKIHGEPNESFEGENVNGIFDGRKKQKFQEIEQTEDGDVNEEGANIEKSMKKVNGDEYEKVQNEENEGIQKNITKKKYERLLQEEANKEISKASNAAKVFPKKMLDSPVETREGRNNTRIEKTKGIKESIVKESSMEPFEAMKVSKLEPFEANDDDHKNFIEPKKETKDEEPNVKNSNKEGFDGKITINEKFSKKIPKGSHEESEGLNVLKMQETKDVKRKGKEIKYLKEEDEGDRLKRMDVEETKVNNIREIMQEEIENSENGIKRGGQQEVAEIEGIKGLNVAKEGEEESKERSKEIEQDDEGVSHNIVDSSQRVFEEALIQESEESKQKEVEGSKCDSKERLKEVLKESSKEQNELREPKVPQMEKAKSTKGRKNGGMDSEKKSFEVNEDDQKVVFGDAIQKDVVKTNEEFPKNLPKKSFDESEGLNVQKIQESKNVKEEMVDKEIEYFKEKGEGEGFKRMYVETKIGKTRETMQEEIEKSDNEIKESGQQQAKENTTTEMDDVSKNVTGELKQKVTEIDESKGFNVAKEEEQKEVTKKGLVESESLMEKVEGKESKERTKAKKVQDQDDKIEFDIVKLKGEGTSKIRADGRSFQEKEESKNVNEKGEKTEKFEKKVKNKIQNEGEDFKKVVTKEKDECYLSNDVRERKSQDTKDAKEDIPMKILDSQNDTREKLKDRKIEKIKGLEENEKVVPFVKKVKFEEEEFKERTKAIVKDEGDKIEYGIVKLNGEGSTKITHKFQEKEEIENVNEKGGKTKEFVKKVNEKIQNEEDEDFEKNTIKEGDGCFLQEEKNEGRSQASKAVNEPCEDIIEKENSNKKLDPIDELVDKENVSIGLVDGRKTQKFQVINQTQDAKEKGANSEKTMKKMSGNKHENIQNEEIDGLRNDIDGPNFGESMTKEELQEFEIERIRNPDREFQSVVSMGFKEFDYKNAKDKKQKTKVLDTKFESKERNESKDESTNQEVFSPKKPKVGENFTRNKLCTNVVDTMEDQVINPISVPRFQSEVEEKDIESLIEMKEKDEFHNGEEVGDRVQEKTNESEKKTDYREQENAARDDGKVETKEKDTFKELKTTQNVHNEKNKIHETMKTTREKKRSVKFEVDDKEEKSLGERPKNDIAEMKTAAYEGAKSSKLQGKSINQQSKDEINRKSECVTEEHEATKEFSPKNVEKGKVVKKREGLKVADSEETKDDSTLTTIQTTEENKPKMKEKTSQLDMASGSKSVAEKVHETLKREDQRKSEESPAIVERKKAHELTIEPNMNNEIPKVEEVQKEKEEEERYINVPEATISKEGGTQVTTTHSKEKQRVEPRGEVDKLQDEQIGQIVEKYTNKDEQAKHGIDEQKEAKDETSEGKNDNAKIPKTVEEEKILKRREESKVAKSEEEMKPKMEETTPQFDLASGSKRVAEKVHETPEKVHEHERKSEESTSKFEVEPLNIDNEIPKVEELRKEEVQKNDHVLQAIISKEDPSKAKATHSKQKMVQQSIVPNSLNTQQLEDEGEELEQCINKDEEENHEIEEFEEEEKDNEKVHEEHKEDKDETDEGKKDSAKTSKNLFVPLVIAGSAFFATTAFIIVRHRRSKKM
ncbi:uncharacterized protein LOC131653049 [Vicia villosa]|uniref:uncharacterized protein LOC131653049 n=1 Tax=Vicia villosa TaxID=3911 RepID=UPI00273B2312|nr:uncharacterized protein LOC131653049 [Vicia villosa]XP_058779069.1 uncharacterized protein LOC131653049 [Vicia villosa]XP_058779070.1 uncharacterized protein LOC131653049 [Vicia villosa]